MRSRSPYRPRRPGRTLLVLLVLVAALGGLLYTGSTFLSGFGGPLGGPPPPPALPPRPPAPDAPLAPDAPDAPEAPDAAPAPGAPPAPDAPEAPPGRAAQAVRTFFELEDEGERAITADLDVALGRVVASRAERGALFQAEVALASDRLQPRFEHTSRGGEARVEMALHGEGATFRGVRATRGNTWQLYFSDRAPLDLDLDLGAAEADLDFTGVPLRRLTLASGMANVTIRFDAPNPIEADRLEIEAGLSSFTARGLGNARFRTFDFDGGAGEFTLDFTGHGLRPGATATIDVGMASLTVLVPAGHPVRLDAPSSFVTRVSVPPALASIGGGRWASPGAEHDPDAFAIDIDAGPGRVDVRVVE